MDNSGPGQDGSVGAGRRVAMNLAVVTLALVIFMAGRLWSYREVRDAQRAAGRAEEGRIALQKELAACRNAILLQREPDRDPPRR